MNVASRRSSAFAWAAACSPLACAWPRLAQAIESRMVLQMLLLFPLLFASGWACSTLLGDRLPLARRFVRIDAGGVLGATFASCVSAFWMLPTALDLSLLCDPMRLCKYASWWLAGAALCRSWSRLERELIAFFGGNLSWMLATAGLLYQSTDERLCVNYLLDDQLATGRALVVAAIVLVAAAIWRVTVTSRTDRTRTRSCGSAAARPPSR